MKSSNFFIKSNYIKNAKNNWVFCEGRLFYHQNIIFLHLKSINIDRNSSELICDSGSNCSGVSTLPKLQQHRSRSKQKETRLNILCNLLEFKSCEIKSVNFEYTNKFAIKLVPSSFLSTKKLYLLPDLEDSLTEWCGLITGFITKTINFPITESSIDDRSTTTLSSTISTNKSSDKSNTVTNSNSIYISLDENDAYESSSQNEFYFATIEPSEDSIKLNLHGQYVLKLSFDSMELINPSTRECIHTFPYSSIRRFGAKESIFRLEAGRHCSTGNGSFTFQVKGATQIADTLKDNAKQIKNKKSTHSSCMTLNRPSTIDVSLQVETKRDSSLNSIKSSNLITPTFDTVDNVDNISISSENYESPKTPQNERKEIYDTDSAKTVVEEVENIYILPLKISQDRKDSFENIITETLEKEVYTKDELIKEDEKPEDVFEEETECSKSTDSNDLEKINLMHIRNITLPVLRLDNILSDSDLNNQNIAKIINESESEKELRSMSLFESSSYRNSIHTSSSPSITPCPYRNCTPPIKSDYKVSDSTFFKYRILPKQPIPVLSSLHNKNFVSNSFTRPTKITQTPMDIQSPKKSPPPLLPKPKFKLSEESCDQNGYREFDQMLKDLQLSLS